MPRAGRVVGGGWGRCGRRGFGGGGGGGGVVGLVRAGRVVGGGGEGGGGGVLEGLGTHWKLSILLNTSKRGQGGGVGGGVAWGRWGWRGFGHTREAFKHDKNTGKGGQVGAVGAVRAEGVLAHIGSL